MVAWAEELGAEATTVTELLEEDNEEVGLGELLHILLLEEVHLRFIFLQVKLEIMAQIQKVNRKAISNAQKVNDSCSALDFHTCTFFSGAQVYDRPKRLLAAGRGADSNNEVEEAHCDGDVRKEDSAGAIENRQSGQILPNSIQIRSIMNQLCRCTSTRRRVPCGDDLLLHSMPSSRSIIT